MNVSLTPELEKRIAEKISSGLYTSASEVVREGLRLLFEMEELRERRLQRLRTEIQVGIDQLDRGESVPAEEAFERLTKRLEARRRKTG